MTKTTPFLDKKRSGFLCEKDVWIQKGVVLKKTSGLCEK